MGWKPITQAMTPLSGDDQIDGVIQTDYVVNQDPKITYNYQLPFKDHINVSFSTADYTPFPTGSTNTSPKIDKVFPLSEAQKSGVRNALGYISSITGIKFNETKTTADESNDLFFGRTTETMTVNGNTRTGVDYYTITKKYDILGNANTVDLHDSNLISSDSAYNDMSPGSGGYQLILGLILLDLGMKRPDGDTIKLNTSDYDQSATLLSTTSTGTIYSTIGWLDVRALNYLYGGDGLRGQWGLTIDGWGNPVSHGPQPSSSSRSSSDLFSPQGGILAQG